MHRVIIVQARMTSTRLPGKILMDLDGEPMLARQLRRLKRSVLADSITVATTTNSTDDPVEALARREHVECYRGSEHDVLGRYVRAALQSMADVVVRITADCPLIDPELTDRVISELLDHAYECDYASNVVHRTYPRGLDVEAFFLDTLLRMDRFGQSQAAREHVTLVLRSERPELFLCCSVEDIQNNADLRWTVDTASDMEFVQCLYRSMGEGLHTASYLEILEHVKRHPELSSLNTGIKTWDPVNEELGRSG